MTAAFTQRSRVSALEIDRDRATINAQLIKAQSETAKYSGGAIKVFADLRIAVLKNTLAMLDQDSDDRQLSLDHVDRRLP